MNIHVHIERLVMDGLPVKGGEGAAVQAAVEVELSRLLGERGLAGVSAGAVPYVSAGSIELSRENRPTHLGGQIARAIHAGIGPQPAVERSSASHGKREA